MRFFDELRELFPVLTRTVSIFGVVVLFLICRLFAVGILNMLGVL